MRIEEKHNLIDEHILLDFIQKMEAPEGYIFASDTKFNRLFGRDSIITSLQLLPWYPKYAKSTLETLTNLQKENGQILHETIKEETMWDSIDSSPLYLILAGEYLRVTEDLDFIKKIFPNIKKAMDWAINKGDLDGDSFLEYKENKTGLTHHCWKDSRDGITHESGKIPAHPIAPAEVQGYYYKALLETALIYDLFKLKEEALKLRNKAKDVKDLFNDKYWMEDKEFYCIALDGKKNKIKTISSNIGHVLWSGIIKEDRVGTVVKRLLKEDIFTEAGLRTLSDQMGNYDPFSYHNGNIWPFDNWFFAEALEKYNFHTEATTAREALLKSITSLKLPYECYTYHGGKIDIKMKDWTGEDLFAEKIQAWTLGALFSFIKKTSHKLEPELVS